MAFMKTSFQTGPKLSNHKGFRDARKKSQAGKPEGWEAKNNKIKITKINR
jgi:hypothetical protein